MEKIDYKGWPNCIRLSNDNIEAIVTTDVGPRVIRFGFVGQENEFKNYDEMMGLTGHADWHIYGGHRLWLAPESKPGSYHPDNQPVSASQHPGFMRFTAPTESTTGMQKEIDIGIDPNADRALLVHRIHNRGPKPVELAPWALSVMAVGGTAIVPLPPRGRHEDSLLPTNSLTLWAYTDMTDARWTWGKKYILLRQDTARINPQKLGTAVPDGWAAYARDGHLFVKQFDFDARARYPDLGCAVETFTNGDMLELETLGPLIQLAPGASVEHTEKWSLLRGVPMPRCDADVDRDVLPLIQRL